MRMLWRKCAHVAGEDPAQGARWGTKTMDNTSLEPSGIKLLVHGIWIDAAADRKVSATITYAFSPERVADSYMLRSSGKV